MSVIIENLMDSAQTPAVRGVLHRPAKPSGDGIVLTHGAGGNCNAPLLVALAEAFAKGGVVALRCDLPFRQARAFGPPRGNGAEDRAGLRRAVQVLKRIAPGRIFLGGQSYGGRQASMLVAEEPGVADSLLLLSYPLHPPGKPTQLRTTHLPKIQMPSQFVSGSKDPFGSPAELQSAMRLIPAKTSFLLVDGAGHDLGFGRRKKSQPEQLPSRILLAFQSLISSAD